MLPGPHSPAKPQALPWLFSCIFSPFPQAPSQRTFQMNRLSPSQEALQRLQFNSSQPWGLQVGLPDILYIRTSPTGRTCPAPSVGRQGVLHTQYPALIHRLQTFSPFRALFLVFPGILYFTYSYLLNLAVFLRGARLSETTNHTPSEGKGGVSTQTV